MRKSEWVLLICAVMLLLLSTVLLVAHGAVGRCVDLVAGGCEEVGFAYEGAGKLALLMSFTLFLVTALHGLFRRDEGERRKR